MTIGQKIIFSSTLVALLAALAAFMGWKNTQPIKNELVNTLTHTTEEIRFLDDIKNSFTATHFEVLEIIKNIADGTITNTQAHLENGRLIDSQIKALKTQINTFDEFNSTKKEEITTELLSLCESFNTQITPLFLSKNLQSKKEALDIGRALISYNKKFTSLINTSTQQRFSFIKQEGEKVESQISKLNFWIILVGGLTFLLAIVFGRVIASNLSSEINSLRTAAEQLNKGDYSARAGLKSNDEFGKLGQTFDGMAANLQQAKVIEKQQVELERLNEVLKVKNDSLDSFVYRVSHDLKAPVVNIKSLLKLLKLRISNIQESEVSQSFLFLEKSTDKLQKTIVDLLEVSRIERSLNTEKEWLNLNQILNHIESENSEKISASNVKITSDFKVSDLYFSGPNLDSILSNLVNNAIKYSAHDRRPEIHLETMQLDDYVCLKISDNGIGIDLEKHGEKLFGMFNRFHNHVEGSGVGLYIIKKIVDNSGGRIEIESEVDQGTTFSIFLNQKSIPANLELEV